MEKLDLGQIELKNSGLYNSNYAFSQAFKKHNITLVSQVLDEDLMNEVMLHCQSNTRKSLMGFISLVKYKFFKIPIVHSVSLDKLCSNHWLNELYSMGFCTNDIERINRYLEIYKSNIQIDINNLKKFKLIEVLKGVLPFCSDRLGLIIKINLENYEQNKIANQETKTETSTEVSRNINSQNSDVIKLLKAQVTNLISMRNNIDTQIENLQQKIEELTDSKGGIKK